VREQQLDEQLLTLFRSIRIGDDKVRDWFLKALRALVREGQQDSAEQVEDPTANTPSSVTSRISC